MFGLVILGNTLPSEPRFLVCEAVWAQEVLCVPTGWQDTWGQAACHRAGPRDSDGCLTLGSSPARRLASPCFVGQPSWAAGRWGGAPRCGIWDSHLCQAQGHCLSPLWFSVSGVLWSASSSGCLCPSLSPGRLTPRRSAPSSTLGHCLPLLWSASLPRFLWVFDSESLFLSLCVLICSSLGFSFSEPLSFPRSLSPLPLGFCPPTLYGQNTGTPPLSLPLWF